MRPIFTTILAGTVLFALVGPIYAQALGEAKRGQSLAETVCAECHAVRKGQLRARDGHAPTFETLATTPGITPMAIMVALRTSHSEMPNLVLKNQEIDDIIAYVATLR